MNSFKEGMKTSILVSLISVLYSLSGLAQDVDSLEWLTKKSNVIVAGQIVYKVCDLGPVGALDCSYGFAIDTILKGDVRCTKYYSPSDTLITKRMCSFRRICGYNHRQNTESDCLEKDVKYILFLGLLENNWAAFGNDPHPIYTPIDRVAGVKLLTSDNIDRLKKVINENNLSLKK